MLSGWSHLTQVRGLKCWLRLNQWISLKVAPYVGAWIEIGAFADSLTSRGVAPYVGAWIEIPILVS